MKAISIEGAICVALVVLALAISCIAQQNSDHPHLVTGEPDPAKLRVTVADILSSQGVAGATIIVRKRVIATDVQGHLHLLPLEESIFLQTKTTDVRGEANCEIDARDSDIFAVEVWTEEYESQAESLLILHPGRVASLQFLLVPQDATAVEAEYIRDLHQTNRFDMLLRQEDGEVSPHIPAASRAAVLVPDEVQVVNLNGFTGLMNFDEFLAGVVTAEMNDGFPQEALRAQAVAARSYALHRLQTLGRANGGQTYSSTAGNLSRAAATYTTKQILLYNGAVIQAFFSARCNGDFTLNSEDGPTLTNCVKGGLGGGVVPYCRSRPCSGHVNCSSTSEQCCHVTINGMLNHIYGHGVGLCQRGAQQFASRDGLGYEDILQRFYTGVHLQRPDNQTGTSDYPGATWLATPSENYSTANRSSADVRWIIIHTTEGTTASAVQRFQNPAEEVSTHYIISRDGSVIQMVRNKDIAYTAGNWAYNQQGINIEHERYGTNNWTEAQFTASANLIQWLTQRYSVSIVFPAGIAPASPASGTGIIGHAQVPDPNNPSLGGGASHHTDPVNWDWAHYQSLFGIASSIPTVETRPTLATEITTHSATIRGRITADGGSSIVDRRFDWGTNTPLTNSIFSSSIAVSGNDFSATLDGLSPNTTYQFRAWARNGSSQVGSCTTTPGWGCGSILPFTTDPTVQNYTITVAASPSAGGIVNGDGVFPSGSSRTVTATANNGYSFANWTENGGAVSSSASFSFMLTSDRNLTANFIATCTFSLAPISVNLGAGVGSGSFNVIAGGGCAWTAVANRTWIYTNSMGSGNGTVNYTVDANTTADPLTGAIVVGGQTFTITQAGTSSANFNPADTNKDWALSINEITAYGAAWKGGTLWPTPPNPIPIDYVTRVGFLWKNGERYRYDSAHGCPGCWMLGND